MLKRVLIIMAVTLVAGAGLLCLAGLVIYENYSFFAPYFTSEPAPSSAPSHADTDGPLTDAGHFGTENNWIAATIAQELTGFCWLANHPNAPVPIFAIKANVDPKAGRVHLEINGWFPDKAVTMDLNPAYAWDPAGYAPLARKLMGPVQSNESAAPNSSQILADLLTPTGHVLGTTDAEISHALLQSPASATLHDRAALLLLTVAWREDAGLLTDTRRFLCRASAHLALAQTLSGPNSADWPGKIANTLLLTLSGREVDARKSLDSLSADASANDDAKIWLRVLRLASKDDWRLETPDNRSPLLMKIIWFRDIARSFTDASAASKLDNFDPLDEVPDWSRALFSNGGFVSVEAGHRFCESSLALELKELGDILAAEGNPVQPGTTFAKIFSDKVSTSVFLDDKGSNNVSVVGGALFKDVTWRELFLDVSKTHFWLRDTWGVPDADQQFLQKTKEAFHGVPRERYLTILLDWNDPDTKPPAGDLQDDVADVPPGLSMALTWPAGEDRLCAYFDWGVPFNAPYAMESRVTLVVSNRPGHENSAAPKYEDLLVLAPDSYQLSSWIIVSKFAEGGHMSREEEQALLSPYFDYNSYALYYFQNLAGGQNDFDDATMEMILRKQCALDPDEYFSLGGFLRAHGKLDAAADADRQGVLLAHDRVMAANGIQPLIEYDYQHGLKDEALQIAQNAADIYSASGIKSYVWLLCKLNRFDEAEDWAKKNQDRYGGDILSEFYTAHRDHFPDQYNAIEKTYFPNGLTQVGLYSFTAPPTEGIEIESTNEVMEKAGLRQGDVIVALDSRPVKNKETYAFVRSLSDDPAMDLILWRGGKYLELKPSFPDRRFGVQIKSYSGQ